MKKFICESVDRFADGGRKTTVRIVTAKNEQEAIKKTDAVIDYVTALNSRESREFRKVLADFGGF